MRTAILSALAEEQQGLVQQLENPTEVMRAGRKFWSGSLHGLPVMLALSRIGKVAAATTATVLIEAFDVERIVFTGVAGGLGKDVRVGDVVVATEFLQHDMDASPLFPRFHIPLYGRSSFECDARLTTLLLDASRQVLASDAGRAIAQGLPTTAGVHQGLIVSGDSFVSTVQTAGDLKLALQAVGLAPLAVEMEGAAVAQVCLDYGLPFAAVRSISDRADEHAAMDFQYFVANVASHYALAIVDHLMRALAGRSTGTAAAI